MADSSHLDDEVLRAHQEHQATTLDKLGDYLIEQAGKVGSVASLSTAIQREAIELAKEILDKLKLRFGEVNILNGMNFTQDDDVTTMGDMKGALRSGIFAKKKRNDTRSAPRTTKWPRALPTSSAVFRTSFLDCRINASAH